MAVRVLIVDDVEELRGVLAQALRLRGGFEIVGLAGTGEAAIAAAGDRQPDIVVLDLGLPDLAGHEVMNRLRAVAPGARIVVYSGSLTPDRMIAARSADAFVEKSQDVAYLVSLLSDLGRGRDRSAEMRIGPSLTDLAAARRFVLARCREWRLEHVVDDARLVVTELVTNALVHARTACTLRIGTGRGVLRVEVTDDGPGFPDLQDATPDDEQGRGLLLVSVLCDAWGAEVVAGEAGRKRVWAEIATGAGPPVPAGGGVVEAVARL